MADTSQTSINFIPGWSSGRSCIKIAEFESNLLNCLELKPLSSAPNSFGETEVKK